MPKTILGIVGETGAGKGEVVEYLEKKLKSRKPLVLRFSWVLSEILKLFFEEVKKQDQQWLGLVLRERFGKDILAKSIEKKIEGSNTNLVILDGLRVKEEVEMLKKHHGRLVYISAPASIRWQRVSKRGDRQDDRSSFKKFMKIDQAPTEQQIKEIRAGADFKIDNSGDWKNLYQQLDNLISKLKLK